jgi:hypothetical protein
MAEKGRSRRDLLRSLSGASFFSTLAEACTPAPQRQRSHSTNPPSQVPVIPAGREAEVVALLGPLAQQPALGYKLAETHVAPDRIDYSFAGPGGAVRVSLVSIAAVDAGVVHAYTRSFRLLVGGDAPEEARHAVGDLVADEIRARDDGQLWVRATDAPRR